MTDDQMNDAIERFENELREQYGANFYVTYGEFGMEMARKVACAAREAAIEECASAIDAMNDSAGGRANYDNREMYDGEIERMNALRDAAAAIRALREAKL
jgi:hypothetical protein